MSEPTRFTIGSRVECRDGTGGDLTRLVIDPVSRAVTHLVVEPRGRVGMARLVPIQLADAGSNPLKLSSTVAEFEKLPAAEETQFVPGAADSDFAPGQIWLWPYYGLGMGGLGGGPMAAPATYDKVPLGEIEIRRGERVVATDGAIGQVQGLVIDPSDHHVTHVLLAEGHLWGRKQVALPIRTVADVTDGIQLRISKAEVEALPDIRLGSRPEQP